MKMCRACLATKKDMVPMSADFVKKYILITDIDIKWSENVPLYTCSPCINSVKLCTEFREKCILADIKFKEIFTPNYEPEVYIEKKNQVLSLIKEEVKLEYDSDPFELEDYNQHETSYVTEATDETDLPPKKPTTTKCLKRKVEKDPKKTNTSARKRANKENKNGACDLPPKKPTTTRRSKRIVKKEPKETNTSAKKSPVKENKNDILEHCGICSNTFPDMGNLVKHLESHKKDISCGLCTESFLDLTHLLSHRVVHIPENNMKCHVCLKKVKTAERLEYHYIDIHNLRGGDGKLFCKHCQSAFTNPRYLKRHIKFSHSDIKYICDHCGKGFRGKNAIRSHMVIHYDYKVYKCDLCDFTCKQPSGVSAHKMRRHTKGTVKCKNCGRVFANQDLVDKHNCKYPSGTICTICGTQGIKFPNLARHMRLHRPDASDKYKCGRCPANFRSSYALKVHNDRHDGNQTVHCEYCPMKFYCKSSLIKHRRTHTGERPYTCKLCSKGFKTNYNLKIHMKVHGLDMVKKRDAELPPQLLFYG